MSAQFSSSSQRTRKAQKPITWEIVPSLCSYQWEIFVFSLLQDESFRCWSSAYASSAWEHSANSMCHTSWCLAIHLSAILPTVQSCISPQLLTKGEAVNTFSKYRGKYVGLCGTFNTYIYVYVRRTLICYISYMWFI